MKNNSVILGINKGELSIHNKLDGKIIYLPSNHDKNKNRPILKWAGGKQWLSVSAKYLIPINGFNNYFEPFMGGGSLFFALEPENAVLMDNNKELITTYRAIKSNVTKVVNILNKFKKNKKFYYSIRSSKPRTLFTIAARIIYLNKTCWNGLYRVNQKGEFNTPFGNYKNRKIFDLASLNNASKLLTNSRLMNCDFEKVEEMAKKGDFVYFDPPYVTGHKNNGFLKYNRKLFSWEDQERLANLAYRMAKNHVNILISNADYPTVISLYKGFYYYKIIRKSLIGGNVDSRGNISEALLSSYPIQGIKSEVI